MTPSEKNSKKTLHAQANEISTKFVESFFRFKSYGPGYFFWVILLFFWLFFSGLFDWVFEFFIFS